MVAQEGWEQWLLELLLDGSPCIPSAATQVGIFLLTSQSHLSSSTSTRQLGVTRRLGTGSKGIDTSLLCSTPKACENTFQSVCHGCPGLEIIAG